MKKLLLFLMFPLFAFAQGSLYTTGGPVTDFLGRGIGGATITVCTSAGTVASPGAKCTPTASIFSDAALSVPINQTTSPVVTAGGGGFQFYAAPGNYTYSVTGAGLSLSQVFTVQLPIIPGSAGTLASLTVTGASEMDSYLRLFEIAAPVCAATFDYVWADSTAHRIKECDNNGSPVQIVHAGADINNSDQVTGTNGLTLPLSTTVLGTNGSRQVVAATVQGNGSKVQLSTGSTTNGDLTSYDASGNAIDSGAVAANVGFKYASADVLIYLSTSGNDGNDGLSPGKAKLTAQAAFNAATTSGTVAGTVMVACGTYTGPTTWYSNLTVKSTCPQYSSQYASQFGLANNLGGVKFTFSANLTWTLLTNMYIEGVELAFANSGFGLIINSVSVSRFLHMSVTLAGSSSVAAVAMKTNSTTGVANNCVRNYFEDFVIIGNNSGAGNQANGLTLTGSGTVGSGTFVTDNTFINLTVAGGVKNGIDFELNSDTNHFFGVYLNEDVSGAGVGYGLAFNLTTPGSDQDANGEVLMGVEPTGSFTGSVQMGTSSGNHIQMTGGSEITPNVTGGSPTYIIETVMLNGGSSVFNVNGILKASTLNISTTLNLVSGSLTRHATFAGALGCTTGASVGSTCTSASLTWSNTLGDTSYFASCAFDGSTTNVPVVTTVTKVSATQFTVTAAALTAAGATGNLVCNAWHN